MRLLSSCLIVFLFPTLLLAQENVAINDLLNEAKTKLYTEPEQAGKIATYIISQKEPRIIHAQAILLYAKSHYIRGNFNEAVKNAMNAIKFAESSKNDSVNVETKLFALALSRNLGLETVAESYESKLIKIEKDIVRKSLAVRISGKLKQDSILVAFHNGKYKEALEISKRAAAIFVTNHDIISKNEVTIFQTEVLLQSGELDATKRNLKKLKKEIRSDFEKLKILDIEGRLQFTMKEYENAIATFQELLILSEKFPNKNFKNQSLEGLIVNYLALEDTKNFLLYKQQNNLVSAQIETDKNLAINSIYNFINSYQKEISNNKINQSYSIIYILSGFLLLLILVGAILNYLYVSKTREYLAIYKYISPRESVSTKQPKVEVLEKSSIVPEETEHMLLHKLNKFESGKKYTNPDMSIALLASQFDTNTKYLSEVINRQKGKNFNAYINELRINYIIEKLKTDSVYFNYKVSYLAEESGFSSHSSFATVFKSVTGISPTKFMNFLQQRQETA